MIRTNKLKKSNKQNKVFTIHLLKHTYVQVVVDRSTPIQLIQWGIILLLILIVIKLI
jgi:hypothetical protein